MLSTAMQASIFADILFKMLSHLVCKPKHEGKRVAWKKNGRHLRLPHWIPHVPKAGTKHYKAARAFQLATSNVLPDRIVVNQSVPSRVNMLPNMCRHTFPSLDTLMQYVLYDKMSTMSDSMCYMPLICRFHPMIYSILLHHVLLKSEH